MKRKNYFIIALILIGAILFGTVAFVVIRSTRTVNAVVPNQTITAGTRITNDMLTTIQVPVDTPSGYITDRSSLIGQKLKVNAEAGQFLYMSNVMIDWNDVVYGVSVPDDYIITALKIPNDHAVGGLITSGDTVDILGVPSANGVDNPDDMSRVMGAAVEHGYGADGINVYWILANVKILETDSSLSNEDDSLLGTITDAASGGNSDGAYYIVALSYNDYQKVVLAQQYMDLWMNLSPVWNNDNKPLLDVMTYSEIQGLMDAQAQSIIEEIKGENEGEITKKISDDALQKLEEQKQKWMDEHGYEYVDGDSAYNVTDDSANSENTNEVQYDEDGNPIENPDSEATSDTENVDSETTESEAESDSSSSSSSSSSSN